MTNMTLKIIAFITMVIDHTGVIFFDMFDTEILRVIGRISFPIFAYLISEGCKKTSNIRKYLLRLLNSALLIEVAFFVVKKIFNSNFYEGRNIFFTLFLGAFSCYLYKIILESEVKYKKILVFLPLIGIMIAADIFNVDYGWIGVLMIFMPYVFTTRRGQLFSLFIGILLLYGSRLNSYYFRTFLDGSSLSFLMPFSAALSLVFIYFYNGKRGKGPSRNFFYWAYPLHFIIIFLVRIAVEYFIS